MVVQAVVFQQRLAACSLVWASELKLVQHRSIQFMNLSWLRGEWLLAALVEASFVALASTLEAYDVLTRGTFDRMHHQELAHWAHQVLIDFIL